MIKSLQDPLGGLRAGHLKTAASCRYERVAKDNRLMDIEDEIKGSSEEVIYASGKFRNVHNFG